MGNCQNFNMQNDPIQANRIKNKQAYLLNVKTYTWNRDSHGLFDYESKTIQKKIIKAQYAGALIRVKDEVYLQKDYVEENEDTKNLAELTLTDGDFTLGNSVYTKRKDHKKKRPKDADGIGENCIWTIVKSLKNSNGVKGCKLEVEDYLKLGRVRLRVKEIKTLEVSDLDSLEKNKKKDKQNFKFNEENDVLQVNEQDIQISQQNQEEELTCRICLQESEPDNKLINPCKCDGTMAWIHIVCLQKWLKNKLKPKQTQFSVSFVWKTFDCELCKKAFPNTIKIDGKLHDTVEIPTSEPPYVTLEILSRDRNQTRGIHVITLANKNSIKLGRGHDADIRIADISVSRCHASIKYEKGGFYLEDNNSKFGTLKLLKNPMNIDFESNNIAVQIGRSVLNFNLKKNWKVLSVCFGGNVVETQKIDQKPMERRPNLPKSQQNIQNKRKKSPNKHRSDKQLNSNRQEEQIKAPELQQQQIQEQQQQQQIQELQSPQQQSRRNQQQQQQQQQLSNRNLDQQQQEQIQNINQQQQQQDEDDDDEDEEDENNLLLNQNEEQEEEVNPDVQEMLNNPEYEQQDMSEEEEEEEEEGEEGAENGQNNNNGGNNNNNVQQQQQQQQEEEEEKKEDVGELQQQPQQGNAFINFESESSLVQPQLIQQMTSAQSGIAQNSNLATSAQQQGIGQSTFNGGNSNINDSNNNSNNNNQNESIQQQA